MFGPKKSRLQSLSDVHSNMIVGLRVVMIVVEDEVVEDVEVVFVVVLVVEGKVGISISKISFKTTLFWSLSTIFISIVEVELSSYI